MVGIIWIVVLWAITMGTIYLFKKWFGKKGGNNALLLFCCLSVLILGGCRKVDTGEVAFKTSWGEIVSKYVLHEGLYFFNPFGGAVVIYDAKNQTMTYKLKQYTKDIQQVDADVIVTYRLQADKVMEMHRTNGINYREKLIDPIVMELVKGVFGKWEAQEVIPHREEATRLVEDGLRDQLSKFGIDVIIVSVSNIDFSDVFENAVEAKQVAAQEALKAKNDLERVKQEAEQKVTMAKAEATAMEARAQALEKNKSLVFYEAVMKWNGVLPQQLLGNAMPFFDVTKPPAPVKK